jgi:tetratricopeptide (TPR) repeat protein
MKRIVLLLAAAFCVSTAFSQTNVGIDYYYLGDFDNAEYFLQKNISSDPANSNFYLGEIAFVNGETALAAEYYGKALAADPNSMLAKVGQQKMKITSDPEGSEKAFKALGKAYKKSAPLAIAIGRAYLDNGMLEMAEEMSDDALGFDKSNVYIYILRGDILIAQKAEVGDIAGQYEQAKFFDETAVLPYLKLALIYEGNNPTTALENLRKADEMSPNSTIVSSLFGRVYASLGRYPEAIESINKVFAGGDYSTGDIERMARSYYFGEPDKLGLTAEDKFAKAYEWVDRGLEMVPDHFILNRYSMYLDADTSNTSGATDAERFFALTPVGSNKFLPGDYLKYGEILTEAGRMQDALAQYDKAIALDPDDLQTYKNLAEMGSSTGNYDIAARYYAQLMEAKERVDAALFNKDQLVDINTLGLYYYQAGAQKSLDVAAQKENLLLADKTFKTLTELAPESYIGYVYLARTANRLYPQEEGIENGSPKEYYTKTIETIEGREEGEAATPAMDRAYTEGMAYLAYYYYMTDDTANAIIMCDKLLAIDPAHVNANAIKNDILSRTAGN